MIISINQPAYLPWLGYFHRIAVSDLHIVLDHVQFEKNSVTNRNKVRTKEGWCWLTVPVKSKRKFGDLAISGLETADNTNWAAKHWSSLKMNYARAPHFAEHSPFFESVYARRWPALNPLLRELSDYTRDAMGIKTPLVTSTELAVEGNKDELVLNLCRAVGATVYLSGPFGRDYLRPEAFEQAGIQLEFHDYHHPEYPQAYPGFKNNMSAVDLLFNCGAESVGVMRRGNSETEERLGNLRPDPVLATS